MAGKRNQSLYIVNRNGFPNERKSSKYGTNLLNIFEEQVFKNSHENSATFGAFLKIE